MADVLILDVSAGVGEIDFSQIAPHVTGEKLPQVHGAIVRLTEGNIPDTRYLANYNGFKSIGLPVGGYGWHNPSDSATNNKAQAKKLVQVVETLGEYPQLGVWADYESDPKNLTIEQMRQAIWKYVVNFEEEIDNKKMGIYTRKNWWDDNVANATNGYSDIPFDRPLWVSNPRPAPPPLMPLDWVHRYGADCWLLWQYKWMVKFPGCPGSVDYNTFNGDLYDYCAHFGLPLPPTPPAPPPPVEPIVPIGRVEIKSAYQYANCRAGAGMQYADIGDLSRGSGSKTRTVVPIVAETPDWYEVRFYVVKSHVRKV